MPHFTIYTVSCSLSCYIQGLMVGFVSSLAYSTCAHMCIHAYYLSIYFRHTLYVTYIFFHSAELLRNGNTVYRMRLEHDVIYMQPRWCRVQLCNTRMSMHSCKTVNYGVLVNKCIVHNSAESCWNNQAIL